MLGRSMPGWKAYLKPGRLLARHMRWPFSQVRLADGRSMPMSGRCVPAYLCAALYIVQSGVAIRPRRSVTAPRRGRLPYRSVSLRAEGAATAWAGTRLPELSPTRANAWHADRGILFWPNASPVLIIKGLRISSSRAKGQHHAGGTLQWKPVFPATA